MGVASPSGNYYVTKFIDDVSMLCGLRHGTRQNSPNKGGARFALATAHP